MIEVLTSMCARLYGRRGAGTGRCAPVTAVKNAGVDEASLTDVQAYRFALDPSPAQARLLASHCGACAQGVSTRALRT